MNEQDFAFLAYVIVTGRANLSQDEKDRLQALAGDHLRTDDRVEVTLGFPGAGNAATAAGQIVGIRSDGSVKVKLDTPIETLADGMTVETDTVVVQRSQVAREPAPDPAPVA